MKKLVILFLFAAAIISSNVQAADQINWKKELYLSGTLIGLGATTTSVVTTTSLLWIKNAVVPLREALIASLKYIVNPNGYSFPSTSKIVRTSNQSILLSGVAATLLLGYLTKKSYDKYQEEAAKDKKA